MRRREFIRKSTMSAAGIYLGQSLAIGSKHGQANKYGIRNIEKNLAIAMWDFSWMLRHYKGGGFEDWDKALYEL
ncbi:MAG TPA: cellulase-like family protein, partial [Cyclobacteriaceae bacterium]|nr:cellulase-like family protein [Cyclobacteriaceae bacterium]